MLDHQSSVTIDDLESMLINEDTKPKALPLSLLTEITSDFSEEKIIGRGGYAVVYKGSVRNRTIAVKKLSPQSQPGLGEKTFNGEIECLMKVKHKNVVRFLGYCYETQGQIIRADNIPKPVMAQQEQRLLCFQYLPNGSLDKHITDPSCGLEWKQRYQIISGVCEGLHQLHEQTILHMDLKPQNILLDDDMVPKITDFGFSRCLEDNQSKVHTANRYGTLGYMAREFIHNGEFTKRCDLYSLGVIIMELLTGEHKEYCAVVDVCDSWMKRLGESQTHGQLEQIKVCAQIGIQCSDPNPNNRPPDTKDIIDRLQKVDRIQETQESGKPLQVQPTVLVFDLQPGKLSPCSLQLTNDTDGHVAFKLSTTESVDWSEHFTSRLPLYGIVPARSTYTLILTVLERDSIPHNRFCDMILQICPSKYDIWREGIPACKNLLEESKNVVKLTAFLSQKKQSISMTTGPGIRILSMEEPRKPLFSIDAHPTKPWIITGYACGRVSIWNHNTQKLLYSFKVSFGPVYSVKFIARKQWFISSSAEGLVHVYSYETNMQKKRTFKAHSGPVSLAVHPTHPYVVSSPFSGRYRQQKLWDWDQDWKCTQTFEKEYFPCEFFYKVTFDPKETKRFASATYDTVKVWSLDSPKSKRILPGYFKEVTFLEFFTRGDQQYLIITTSHDMTAHIWDMVKNAFVNIELQSPVSPVASLFSSHHNLPALLTCSIQGTSRVYSTKDFRLEGVLDYSYGGDVRGIACLMGSKIRFVIGQGAALTILDIDNGQYQEDSRSRESDTDHDSTRSEDTASEVITQGSSELLHVHPLMLYFPFQADKLTSCSLHLTNNTDKHVAFMLSTEEQMEWWQPFSKMPLSGIVPSRSTYTLVVTMRVLPYTLQEQNFNLILKSSISGDRYVYTFTQQSECDQFFEDAKETGNAVPEVKLKAVLSLQGHKTSEDGSTGQDVTQPLINIWGLFQPAKDIYNVLCSLDADPMKSWIITGHRHGDVSIWKCGTQRIISSINTWEEAGHRRDIGNTQQDVYSVKFITRKRWFVAGTYDGFIHVYKYETRMECLKRFKAHSSGIIDSDIYSSRSLFVHPTQPYVLSTFDVMRLWDWDNDWRCIRIFNKRRSDSIRQVAFSPKDAKTFASASSDHTIKLWSITSSKAVYTLSGHWDKVNCLDFFTRDDGQQYLISGSQDCTAKIWSLKERKCVHTMDVFMSPVVSVISLPDSPHITTGSEDGTVHLWNSASFRLERVLDIGWTAPVRSLCLMGSKRVVIEKMGEISIMDIDAVSEARSLAPSTELIQVEPPKLCFPDIQVVSSTLNISNITHHHVAFSIWSLNLTSDYNALPDKGVLSPHSMQEIVVTRVALEWVPADLTLKEVVFVKATVVVEGLRTKDVIYDMFDETKTGRHVQLVKLDVAFVPSEIISKARLPWTLDVHPTESWIMTTQGDYYVHIRNYKTWKAKHIPIKGKEVTSAKFMASKKLFVVGCSSGIIYVYSYDPEEDDPVEKDSEESDSGNKDAVDKDSGERDPENKDTVERDLEERDRLEKKDSLNKTEVKKIQVLHGHTKSVNTLAVHATMPYVLSASQDGKILIWHYEKKWELIKTIDANTPVMHVAFNPKDTYMFASAQDKTVKIWNIHFDDCKLQLSGHSDLVVCLDYFSLDNKLYLITGSKDKTAKIWDCETGSCVQTLKGHTDVVKIAYCYPDLRMLITGSWDGSVRLWNSNTFRYERTLKFDLGEVYAIASLTGSTRIAVANEKGLALVNIDPENKEDEDVESTDMESTGVVTGFDKFPSQLMEETIYKVKSARTLDFHPTKPWMVVTQADRFVRIWDYRAKGLKWPIEINGAKVTLAKFLAHQQWVMAGTTGGSIHVYDCDSKEQKRVLHKHTKPIKSLAIHGTESLVLSASMDGKILLWDYAGEDWNLRKTFDVKSQCLMQVAFDPKDTNMFASAQDKTVKIWDRCQDDSQLTTILTGHSYQIECLDYFSGGGDKPYMITGSRDKTAKIWDCKNASCVQTLEGHAGPVDIVCCHSGVSILITGCREDGSIRLWNSTDFRLERVLNFHKHGSLRSLSCLNGSPRIAIGCEKALILGTHVIEHHKAEKNVLRTTK